MKFLKMLLRSLAAGAVAGVAVNLAWLAVTGRSPSLLTSLVATQAVTTVWSLAEALRWQRKWQRVVADYQRPALGEGIEIPHRPPADEAA